MVSLGGAGASVPVSTLVIILVVHRGERLCPSGFGLGNQGNTITAACIPSGTGKLVKNLGGNRSRIANNPHADRFGQANPVGVYINLNDFGIYWPVVNPVARQG